MKKPNKLKDLVKECIKEVLSEHSTINDISDWLNKNGFKVIQKKNGIYNVTAKGVDIELEPNDDGTFELSLPDGHHKNMTVSQFKNFVTKAKRN